MINEIVDYWKNNPKTRDTTIKLVSVAVFLIIAYAPIMNVYDKLPEGQRIPVIAILAGCVGMGILKRLGLLFGTRQQ